MNKLPHQLPSEAILAAAHAYDLGHPHAFADSRGYDVIINDRHYPPKAIISPAASAFTGLTFTPADFNGGIKLSASSCSPSKASKSSIKTNR